LKKSNEKFPTPPFPDSMDAPLIMSNAKPIGVFDSGVGGLTVVKELLDAVPNEHIVYFGDTARVPYGTKSARVVREFAVQDALILLKHDVKMIVVACHTATSMAMDLLTERFDLPIIGVVEPGIKAGLEVTKNGKIGVIGTRSTISSGTYPKLLAKADPEIEVFTQACPLFVPLVEEGWLDQEVTRQVAHIYLDAFLDNQVDTVILGCTHYPLLKPLLNEVLGPSISLIDSAEETAKAVHGMLTQNALQADSKQKAVHQYLVSDIPYQFRQIGERFLGRRLESLTQVDVDSLIQSYKPD
jgi:glutamate racemase